MSVKKLLVAGGGYADIPLIRAAKKLGYHVITTGNRPEELGHRESDEYRPGDFSDAEAMLKIAKDARVEAICACCNDFSALSASYVAEKIGLPGHDTYKTTQLIHHKDSYRKFVALNGIPTPQAMSFSDAASALAAIKDVVFPSIVKPVDLTGGKGITKVNNAAEGPQAIANAFVISRTKRIVIEEFIEGSRHGFSAFIRGGKVVFHFADNEQYYLNPYLVSAASAPSTAPEEAIAKLVAQAEKIASLLSLKDGIFHVQFILRGDEPVIIEICRRAPGDLYVRLVEHATGVEYSSWIVKSAAGLGCSGLSQKKTRGFYTRHCVMASRPGILRDIAFDPAIEKKIIERVMRWKPGDRVGDHLTYKLGIVFLKFDSMQEMSEKTAAMHRLIVPKVESPS